MDPWGHLVPWTFKDIIEKENGNWVARIAVAMIYS